MSTLNYLSALYNLSEEDKLELLMLIESRKYHEAINMIRLPGESLSTVARTIQKIAKQELNLDIMPYLK